MLAGAKRVAEGVLAAGCDAKDHGNTPTLGPACCHMMPYAVTLVCRWLATGCSATDRFPRRGTGTDAGELTIAAGVAVPSPWCRQGGRAPHV